MTTPSTPAMDHEPPAPQSSLRARRSRAQRGRWRRWAPCVLGVLFVIALVAAFRRPPAPVETARVVRANLRVTVNEEGRTRVRQRYLVSAPVAGQLRRVPVDAGDPVVAGQTVVAVIDPLRPALLDARSRALAEARRDSAQARLERARAADDFSSRELARVEQLFRDGAASQQELEAAQWRAEAATRERAAAESDLRLAEAELAGFGEFAPGDTGRAEPVVLTSPESGRVLRVFEENARVVSPGTPILEIGNPDDLEVVIEALSRDGATIQPGAAVEFDHWGGGPALSGVVRLVEPSAFTKVSALGVEEQRVNVIADLLTPPAKRPGLGDRFRVDARIVVWEATNVLVAPSGALFRQGPGWAAFVIRDGRAHRQGVSVGRANAQETQILDGLDEGDTVILYPGDRIQDDARVTPIVIEP